MKVKQTIGVNTGQASLTATDKRQKVARETDAEPTLPGSEDSLAHYLAQNGINVPYLRDLLRIYTTYMRTREADQLLSLAEIQDVIAAIERGDLIEATEIFLSFCLKSQ